MRTSILVLSLILVPAFVQAQENVKRNQRIKRLERLLENLEPKVERRWERLLRQTPSSLRGRVKQCVKDHIAIQGRAWNGGPDDITDEFLSQFRVGAREKMRQNIISLQKLIKLSRKLCREGCRPDDSDDCQKRCAEKNKWVPEKHDIWFARQHCASRVASGEFTTPPPHAENITGPPRVVDGDTLVVQGERIRLQGIDAPETRQTCMKRGMRYFTGQRWKCGLEASMALIERIGGRDVSCKIEGRGKYGRAIGVCSLDGEDLNAWMVREGWALAYRRYSKAYVGEEDRAKVERRGIWRGRFVKPWKWRRGERM